jgi:hypothetical protein
MMTAWRASTAMACSRAAPPPAPPAASRKPPGGRWHRIRASDTAGNHYGSQAASWLAGLGEARVFFCLSSASNPIKRPNGFLGKPHFFEIRSLHGFSIFVSGGLAAAEPVAEGLPSTLPYSAPDLGSDTAIIHYGPQAASWLDWLGEPCCVFSAWASASNPIKRHDCFFAKVHCLEVFLAFMDSPSGGYGCEGRFSGSTED